MTRHDRKWRNLLVDRTYQFRFVFSLIGLCSLLLFLLGLWATKEVRSATETAKNKLHVSADSFCGEKPEKPRKPEVKTHKSGEIEVWSTASTDESSLKLKLEKFERATAMHRECEERYDNEIRAVEKRQTTINWLLITIGVLSCVFLFLYGLRFSHRVVGPIYKIEQQMKIMTGGKYVVLGQWRRTDHLDDFCRSFQHAQLGIQKMQEDDIAAIRDLISCTTDVDLSPKGQELRQRLVEILAQKEESLD